MNKNIDKLTKKAQKQLNLVLTHSETLGTLLAELNEATDVEVTKLETPTKRGPGRPPKSEKKDETKRGPGRPPKQKNKVVGIDKNKGKRRRGRPSKVEASLDNTLKNEVERIREGIGDFNNWWDESTKEKEVRKIENGTYIGVIEGFYSSGETGRYGITTRLYINPNSNILPEDLRGNIHTTAVNRIRYVENQEQGLDYIKKQQDKLQNQFFDEVLPSIIDNHGKKGSVYAFHLDNKIRNKFKELQLAVKKIPSLQNKIAVNQ